MNIFINALWMAVAQPGDWTDQLQYQGARRRWPEADRNGGETAQADRVAWQKTWVFFLGKKHSLMDRMQHSSWIFFKNYCYEWHGLSNISNISRWMDSPNFCDETKPERQTGFLSHVSKRPPFWVLWHVRLCHAGLSMSSWFKLLTPQNGCLEYSKSIQQV